MEHVGAVELVGCVQPGPRKAHASAQCRGADHLVAIHGGQNDEEFFGDLWTYNAQTRRWRCHEDGSQSLRGKRPCARALHTLTATLPQRFVLFGGLRLTADDETQDLGDCWELNLGAAPAKMWRPVPRGAKAPSVRAGHSAVYGVAADGVPGVLLYGGVVSPTAASARPVVDRAVYRLDVRRWVWEKLDVSAVMPAARESASCCWSEHRKSLLVVGGQEAPDAGDGDATPRYLNDVWELTLRDGGEWRWKRLFFSGHMQARFSASLLPLPGPKCRMLMWGGLARAPKGDDDLFTEDYYVLDLSSMCVAHGVASCADLKSTALPQRFLHTCVRVGSSLLVYGGMRPTPASQAAGDADFQPETADGHLQHFDLARELVYGEKPLNLCVPNNVVRAKVLKVDQAGGKCLLSVIVDGKIFIGTLSDEDVQRARKKHKRKATPPAVDRPDENVVSAEVEIVAVSSKRPPKRSANSGAAFNPHPSAEGSTKRPAKRVRSNGSAGAAVPALVIAGNSQARTPPAKQLHPFFAKSHSPNSNATSRKGNHNSAPASKEIGNRVANAKPLALAASVAAGPNRNAAPANGAQPSSTSRPNASFRPAPVRKGSSSAAGSSAASGKRPTRGMASGAPASAGMKRPSASTARNGSGTAASAAKLSGRENFPPAVVRDPRSIQAPTQPSSTSGWNPLSNKAAGRDPRLINSSSAKPVQPAQPRQPRQPTPPAQAAPPSSRSQLSQAGRSSPGSKPMPAGLHAVQLNPSRSSNIGIGASNASFGASSQPALQSKNNVQHGERSAHVRPPQTATPKKSLSTSAAPAGKPQLAVKSTSGSTPAKLANGNVSNRLVPAKAPSPKNGAIKSTPAVGNRPPSAALPGSPPKASFLDSLNQKSHASTPAATTLKKASVGQAPKAAAGSGAPLRASFVFPIKPPTAGSSHRARTAGNGYAAGPQPSKPVGQPLVSPIAPPASSSRPAQRGNADDPRELANGAAWNMDVPAQRTFAPAANISGASRVANDHTPAVGSSQVSSRPRVAPVAPPNPATAPAPARTTTSAAEPLSKLSPALPLAEPAAAANAAQPATENEVAGVEDAGGVVLPNAMDAIAETLSAAAFYDDDEEEDDDEYGEESD